METIEVNMTITVDPEDQKTWADIVDASIFTKAHIAKVYKVSYSSLLKYTRMTRPQKPKEKQFKIMVEIMKDLLDNSRPKKHPSFGYATPEEIDQLNKMGLGPARNSILKKIAKRKNRKENHHDEKSTQSPVTKRD